MSLKINIQKIKHIDNAEISLNLSKGLYAITGENGSGKSTIMTCASSSFFDMRMNEYIGKTEDGASITLTLPSGICKYAKINGRWSRRFSGAFKINGFYEGSLIYGNRFRNTSYEKLKRLDKIQPSSLKAADDFIRLNLGQILHGDSSFYENLSVLNHKGTVFNGDVFFYEKNGSRVSQFHMSTGENLLISILNSINIKNCSRKDRDITGLILLDEIELALHPAALKRLVIFMSKIANEYNYAIYFSTHSIELLSSIKPQNIYFIERYADNTIEILNPCYPAYATRILYEQDGYDKVILVEDDLAREIIRRLIKNEKLLQSRLVHVLPCGGYSNVILLANEIVRDNLLSNKTSLSIILDADVQNDVHLFMSKNGIGKNLPLSFLPIESLEKYLRKHLFLNVDHKLFRILNDYLFMQKSLNEIIGEYKIINKEKEDKDGKKLFQLISKELTMRNKDREELIEIIVDYLIGENNPDIQKSLNFIRKQLA